MDRFRTTVPAPDFPFCIDHQSKMVLLGSCFAEEIGSRLSENKFRAHINPFGILFNPFSIMNALERMLNHRLYKPEDLLHANDTWVSLDHHGRFNQPDQQTTLDGINASLVAGRERLIEANVVFITLGSAWIYEHINQKHIVANCHKIPNTFFEKKLLTYQETHLILRHIPLLLASKGLQTQVVFTVSPVRHWKDGAIGNQRSKAQLISAVHQVVEEFENCHYFPAYEIVMDDLRDYRFYASDMLHPNSQAVDYVWEKFQQGFFKDETRIICNELKAVVQAASHRPVDPESNAFQRFLRKQLEIIEALETRYPNVDLTPEKKQFQAYLL